jgi:hypothetical protein
MNRRQNYFSGSDRTPFGPSAHASCPHSGLHRVRIARRSISRKNDASIKRQLNVAAAKASIQYAKPERPGAFGIALKHPRKIMK